MKKLLLASLIFLASLASFGAATVTLTNGGGCEYSVISILPTGAVTVACTGPVVTPTTPVPQPPGPATPLPPLQGLDLWKTQRWSVGTLQAGQTACAAYQIPANWPTAFLYVAVEISPSGFYNGGLSMTIDDQAFDGSTFAPPDRKALPGNHVLCLHATNLSDGSIDFYHSPR